MPDLYSKSDPSTCNKSAEKKGPLNAIRATTKNDGSQKVVAHAPSCDKLVKIIEKNF